MSYKDKELLWRLALHACAWRGTNRDNIFRPFMKLLTNSRPNESSYDWQKLLCFSLRAGSKTKTHFWRKVLHSLITGYPPASCPIILQDPEWPFRNVNPISYSCLIRSMVPAAIRMKFKVLNCDKGLMIWCLIIFFSTHHFFFFFFFDAQHLNHFLMFGNSLTASHFRAEHATCLPRASSIKLLAAFSAQTRWQLLFSPDHFWVRYKVLFVMRNIFKLIKLKNTLLNNSQC